jgi:CO/xanthine dehydrogenase FAD-binding subunit
MEDALGLLATGGVTIAAGCTDLFPATEARSLPGAVLDITRLPGLRGIGNTGNGLRLGAATTWSDVLAADLPPAFDMLKQAAREVGSCQIQNAGTLAGNLCNASPAADGVPCLLALDASVELTSAEGNRSLPLSDFITGPRRTDLRLAEILTSIHVPKSAMPGRSRFLKLGARRYLVISIAMVAARLEVIAGRVTQAALAIGACGPVATRLPDLEQVLIGRSFDANLPELATEALIAPALSPIADMRADAAYRTHAAAELMQRALFDLVAVQQDNAA